MTIRSIIMMENDDYYDGGIHNYDGKSSYQRDPFSTSMMVRGRVHPPPSPYLKNNQGSLTHQHPLVATNESWDSSNRWPASWDLNQVLVIRVFTW